MTARRAGQARFRFFWRPGRASETTLKKQKAHEKKNPEKPGKKNQVRRREHRQLRRHEQGRRLPPAHRLRAQVRLRGHVHPEGRQGPVPDPRSLDLPRAGYPADDGRGEELELVFCFRLPARSAYLL